MSNIIRCGEEHDLSIQVFTPLKLSLDILTNERAHSLRLAPQDKEQIRQEHLAQEERTVPGASGEDKKESAELQSVLLLQQAQKEAEQCLSAAREEAERYLAAAKTKAAALEEEASKKGFMQGEEAGRAKVLEQYAPVIQSFQRATEEITHLREKLLRLAEEDIVTLAFAIARTIIRQEIFLNREVVVSTVKHTLESLVDREKILVRVHPTDLEQVLALKKDLLNSVKGIKILTLQGDETIDRGGCLVESEFGEIDARINAQFEELEHRFRERLSLVTETNEV